MVVQPVLTAGLLSNCSDVLSRDRMSAIKKAEGFGDAVNGAAVLHSA